MRHFAQALLAVVAGATLGAAVWAADFWREKPASAWTAEEALEVLQDSPWAQEELVALARPRPVRTERENEAEFPENLRRSTSPENQSKRQPSAPRTPAPPDIVPQSTTDEAGSARYLVRWESARAVQAAFERLRELNLGASAEFQAPPSRLPEDRYVVTVKVTRPAKAGLDLFDGLELSALMDRAWLKTRQGAVAPAEVERSGAGANAAVHFLFPREVNGKPLLESLKEKVEFEFQREGLNLRTKFEIHRDDIR